ncbi:unnamed protein product [Phyllotreta striolata]|uniref:Caspase-1 n=1 Tax=Phyllotreta striolata TaxID=444603 RepID=A0A9N9TG70_PHYSR|nr:unnamed protein product [Phyllotreta striolata]
MDQNGANTDNKNQNGTTIVSAVDGIFSRSETTKPPIVPEPDSEVYAKKTKRGMAIIFNHKDFLIPYCSTRNGTEKDRDCLVQVLRELGYEVYVHNDRTYEQIMKILDQASKMDHTDHESLLIAIMSHGEEGLLYAKDTHYPTNRLWRKFSPLHCPTLAGKPKLFFIQACRGSETDPGVKVSYTETDSLSTTTNQTYTIPVMADILIMYATVENYYAWRDPEKGSYFIQALIVQLRKHHESRDLLSILTCVNREVAIGFTSSNPENPGYDGKKEMCSIVSMLTRKYYFT